MSHEVCFAAIDTLRRSHAATVGRLEAENAQLRELLTMYNLGGWMDSERLIRERDALAREVRYLRHYGNKDCTHMADEAMARGDMESPP